MATLTQARSGIARAGATPCAYLTNYTLTIFVNGTNRATTIKPTSVKIHTSTNDEPDTATFTVSEKATWVPSVGELVYIGYAGDGPWEFAGQITTVRHYRIAASHRPWFEVECTDWTRLFDRRVVNTFWESTSASTIVTDILSTYTSGFSSAYVATGLATIDFFPATMARPSELLRRLANLIGGGFRIDQDKVVHFWGPSGDAYAGTAPQTLTDSLTSLKRFSHTYNNDDQRTRALVRGKGTATSATVASGQAVVPVDTIDIFPGIYGDEFLIPEYGRFSWSAMVTGYAGTSTVNTAAAIGATTLKVNDYTAFLVAPAWVRVGGDLLIYFTGASATAAPVGNLTGIPASGPGSIVRAIAVNEPVALVPAIQPSTGAITRQLEAGTPVHVLIQEDDAGAQSAVAAIEGGDGIHEHPIEDERFNVDGAHQAGAADLDRFANTGLITPSWLTQDMQAKVGRLQVINFTGTDALSTTVTIFRSDIEFLDRKSVRPLRTCEGGTVRTKDLIFWLANPTRR